MGQLLQSFLGVGVRAMLAAALLITAMVPQTVGETIATTLNISPGPPANAFIVTLQHPNDWTDEEIAVAAGTVQIVLQMSFDPVTQQPLAVSTVQAIGGSCC